MQQNVGAWEFTALHNDVDVKQYLTTHPRFSKHLNSFLEVRHRCLSTLFARSQWSCCPYVCIELCL